MDALFKVGKLIDGTGGPPLREAGIWVEGSRVRAVICPGEGTPEGLPTVDWSRYTVIPGLIDMHVHIDYWYSHPNRREYEGPGGEAMAACLAANNLRSALMKGVTTVRDVASGVGVKMRRALELGYVQGSRLFTSGKGICMTGGHGWDGYRSVVEADGPLEIRKAVRREIRDGADLVKVLTSHRSERPEYDQEELDALVYEAHRLGRRVACHAAIMPSCEMAVLAGVDTLEHGTHLTDHVREMMAERGIYLVPTMIAYRTVARRARAASVEPLSAGDFDRRFLVQEARWWDATDKILEPQFQRAASAGVMVVLGTDMVLPGVEFCPLVDEAEIFVKCGYGEMNTICAGTRVAAEALGKKDDLGTIEAGKIADFVALGADPLTNISHLRDVAAVVKDGRVEFPVPFPPLGEQ